MKKFFVQLSLTILLLSGLTLSSCKGKPKDSDIQAAATDKLRNNAQYANLSVAVTEGVATLSGQCPDEACKSGAEQAVKEVEGVKSVTNNVSVETAAAPVNIEDDATIRNSVDPIVKKYPGVSADVNGGVITLRGNIKRDDLQKLMQELHATNPKKVENQLTVK